MSDKTPPMPETQAEWAIFWSFYQLTVKERDYERTVNERLRKELSDLRWKIYPESMGR